MKHFAKKILCWLDIHKWEWEELVPLKPVGKAEQLMGYCYIHGSCVRCGKK